MLLYKIRRKSDGKFSTGGSSPRWTGQGKLWKKNHMNSHLTLVRKCFRSGYDPYKDCEIVEFAIIQCRIVTDQVLDSVTRPD